MLVFDLGGTWFRAGLLTGADEIVDLRRARAITAHGSAAHGDEVRRGILAWLTETYDHAGRTWSVPIELCGVSLGAAMDGRTGQVVAGAPLFGAERTDWWPEAELSRMRPDACWRVVNDVSALAYGLLKNDDVDQTRTAAALTVSTGIAYRTIELPTGRIPYDRGHGLQGEIGHLPARMVWAGEPVTAVCDCGERDHVSAYASGRGVQAFLCTLRPSTWGACDHDIDSFAVAVRNGHAGAVAVLDAVTMPLAQVLLAQACLNPDVEHTVVTGGVVDGLGEYYMVSLVGNLDRLGLYGISDRDPDYFARRIVHDQTDGLGALLGAGVYARGIPDRGARAA